MPQCRKICYKMLQTTQNRDFWRPCEERRIPYGEVGKKSPGGLLGALAGWPVFFCLFFDFSEMSQKCPPGPQGPWDVIFHYFPLFLLYFWAPWGGPGGPCPPPPFFSFFLGPPGGPRGALPPPPYFCIFSLSWAAVAADNTRDDGTWEPTPYACRLRTESSMASLTTLW